MQRVESRYNSHCCTTVKGQEMQLVSNVLHQMLSANKETVYRFQREVQ